LGIWGGAEWAGARCGVGGVKMVHGAPGEGWGRVGAGLGRVGADGLAALGVAVDAEGCVGWGCYERDRRGVVAAAPRMN